MRRRKPKEQNPATDKEVFKQELLRLQQSEVFHVIDHYDFTPSEFVDELWDPNMVRLLRELVTYAATGWHSEDFTYGAFRFRLSMTDRVNMVPPRSGLIRIDSPKLLQFFTELGQIVSRWNRAEQLIDNLFKDYTMAEVRYLLPQLQALVPPGHMLRTVNPKPATSTSEQMIHIREAVQTIARGLISNPDRPPMPKRSDIGFQVFHGHGWDASPTFWVA